MTAVQSSSRTSRCPPELTRPLSEEVHLWLVSLDRPSAELSSFERKLSEDERTRANAYRFELHRKRFIVARAALRAILGRYLGLEPEQVCLGQARHGKPRVTNPVAATVGVCFNVAHSQELMLFAISRHREVGVDLEFLHPVPETPRIVERFLSAREQAMFNKLPAAQRQEAFFNCWTRKEALLKARGHGLIGQSLDQVEVTLVPGEPTEILSIDGNRCEANHWKLHPLNLVPDCSATLAARGTGWRVCSWAWPPLQSLATW